MSAIDGEAAASRSAPEASQANGVIGRLLARAANVLIPAVCMACRTPLVGHDALCARCWISITFIRPPLCDRLGIPMPFGGDGGPLISAAAAASPPVYDRARAVAIFDAAVRDIVHGLKYADRLETRRLLSRWLHEAGRELFPGTDVVAPVPLTRWRLMRRQFNQSAILAQDLARATSIRFDPMLLTKTRTTPPQVGLTREQRRANVRGAFVVPRQKQAFIVGRNVLLIDDVITTGATVEACARALKRAGAARVDVLAVGLVVQAGAVTV